MEKQISKLSKIIIYIFLTVILLVTVIPILYTILASFKSNVEILAHPENFLPTKPTLENYKLALSSDYFNVKRMAWNSTYYTLICVIATLLTSSMAGYAFARGEFYGKGIIFMIFSSLMFISLGTIVVYPMFDVLRLFGLTTSLWGLIVVKIFGISIANIYLVRSYVRTLPRALDEAAAIDGCSFVGTFFKIIAPLLKPILATIGILSFNASWNDYLMPTIFTMGKPEQRTLIAGVVALKTSGEAASSWNLMLAGTTIALIPILIAFLIGNRYLVEGLTNGAVKG